WEWVKKGVPVRVEIGPRDLEKGSVCVCRRDQASNEKSFMDEAVFVDSAVQLLEDIQNALLQRQLNFRDSHIRPCSSLDELKSNFSGEGDADWLLCPWDGSPEEEEELAKSLRISIRCIPHGEMGVGPAAPCILTGRPTTRRVLWARSY
ncbi:MAG: proline--tRNA ligase, partial [Akkermansia sp.]|nr:proline--tRNA ligase [Akkermansia sp.]